MDKLSNATRFGLLVMVKKMASDYEKKSLATRMIQPLLFTGLYK